MILVIILILLSVFIVVLTVTMIILFCPTPTPKIQIQEKAKVKINQKLIILIICSNNLNIYEKFIHMWLQYMNSHEHIKSFFIFGDGVDGSPVEEENNVIRFPIKETYIPGILQKTIAAFQYIDENYEYDYILRTNLSSFIILDRLYQYVQNNEHIMYGGVSGGEFISGSGILMSKECNKMVLKNRNDINEFVIDDVAIGRLLGNLHVSQTRIPRMDFSYYYPFENNSDFQQQLEMLKTDDTYYHVRIMSPNRDSVDPYIYQRLIQTFY